MCLKLSVRVHIFVGRNFVFLRIIQQLLLLMSSSPNTNNSCEAIFALGILPFELTHLISLAAACRLHRGTFVVIPNHNYYSPIFHIHRLTTFSCRMVPPSGRDFTLWTQGRVRKSEANFRCDWSGKLCYDFGNVPTSNLLRRSTSRTSICIRTIDKIGIGLSGVSYSTFSRFSSEKFYGSIKRLEFVKQRNSLTHLHRFRTQR